MRTLKYRMSVVNELIGKFETGYYTNEDIEEAKSVIYWWESSEEDNWDFQSLLWELAELLDEIAGTSYIKKD